MRIGLITGGGDCPGLNAAIRAVVRHALDEVGATVYGFRDGWRGVMEGTADELTRDEVRGILPRGGTILGTSGVQPFRTPDGVDRVRETIAVHRLDGIIAIGGEGTMASCAAMPDVPVIGVPKTIDNDIVGTDHSIGFQTAVQIAAELIDRLYSTAESHQRLMVCEVMGRSCRVDRTRSGHRRRCRRHLAAGASLRHRAGRAAREAADARGPAVLDRGGVRRRRAGARHDGRADVSARRERVASSRGHRRPGRPGARVEDRRRVAGHGARTCAAGWLARRLRPRPRDEARHRRRRGGDARGDGARWWA